MSLEEWKKLMNGERADNIKSNYIFDIDFYLQNKKTNSTTVQMLYFSFMKEKCCKKQFIIAEFIVDNRGKGYGKTTIKYLYNLLNEKDIIIKPP